MKAVERLDNTMAELNKINESELGINELDLLRFLKTNCQNPNLYSNPSLKVLMKRDGMMYSLTLFKYHNELTQSSVT
jgi:hypothetical protein